MKYDRKSSNYKHMLTSWHAHTSRINDPLGGEFQPERPVITSFDGFFVVNLDNSLNSGEIPGFVWYVDKILVRKCGAKDVYFHWTGLGITNDSFIEIDSR